MLRNKPDTKGQILYDFVYEISRTGKFIEVKSRIVFAWGWGQGK